jgi:hypothetical protein
LSMVPSSTDCLCKARPAKTAVMIAPTASRVVAMAMNTVAPVRDMAEAYCHGCPAGADQAARSLLSSVTSWPGFCMWLICGAGGKRAACGLAAVRRRELGRHERRAAGARGVGGLTLAAVVKSGLRYGWRHVASPRGKGPGAHRAVR